MYVSWSGVYLFVHVAYKIFTKIFMINNAVFFILFSLRKVNYIYVTSINLMSYTADNRW